MLTNLAAQARRHQIKEEKLQLLYIRSSRLYNLYLIPIFIKNIQNLI